MDIAEPFLKEIIGRVENFYFCSWKDLVMICVGPLTVLIILTWPFLLPSKFLHVFPSFSQLIIRQPCELDPVIKGGGWISDLNQLRRGEHGSFWRKMKTTDRYAPLLEASDCLLSLCPFREVTLKF